MPSVSFVSVIRALPLALAARSIGMLCMERIHGTGTYIPMDFMLMHSLHSAILYGGIGDIIPMVPDGVGDGHVLTMDGVVTIPVIGVAGMAVGTVAAIGAVIGDIIMVIIPDGAAVIIGQGLIHTIIPVVLPIREAAMSVRLHVVFPLRVLTEQYVHLLVVVHPLLTERVMVVRAAG